MMINLKRQKGSILLPYLGFFAISAGVAGYYVSQTKLIDTENEFLKNTSVQVEQLQAAQLSCFSDLRRWCTPGELPNYLSGDTATLNGDITFVQDGDNLRFSVNMSNDREANVLSELLVNSTSAASIATSTIRPPTEASIFSDRLQRYESTTNPDRMVMATDLDLGLNQLPNIGALDAQRITSDNIVADVLSTQRTIVNSELDLDGNRIISNSGDIEIIAGTVQLNNDLTVTDNVSLNNASINNVNAIDANSANIDQLSSTSMSGVDGNFNNVFADSVNVTDVIANTANIDNLTNTNSNFVTAIGDSLTVNSVNSTSANIDDFVSDDAIINQLSASNLNAQNGVIEQLTSQQINTNNISSNSAVIDNASINTLSSTNGSANVLSSNALTAAIGSINNLTVNNTLINDDEFVVNGTIGVQYFTGNGPVSMNDAVVNNAVIDDVNVTTLDINDTDAALTNLRVVDITVTETGANIAEIVDVWVNDNFTADEIVATIGQANLLEVDNANIANGIFTTLNMQSGSVNNAYAALLVSNDITSNSMSADTINAQNANIGRFEVGTLNVDVATGQFIADDYNGDNYYASGDFFTQQGSLNTNANNLVALYNALDNCVNVTGYCLEKEPDFLLECNSCEQRAQQFNFTSELRVTVGECLQGCTIDFDIDGMNAISGCSSRSFAAGYSGTLVCRVGAQVPSATTSVFNPVVTMANARRAEFNSSITSTITYENTTPRSPQFRLTCTDCNKADDSGIYESTINVEIQQCAEGCELSFNVGSLSVVSGCNTQSFVAGYTGTASCRVRTNLGPEQTLTERVTATLSNTLFGDSSSLFADVNYENTEVASNPPQFTLACANCTQASTGGSYTVDLVLNITNCEQGCFIDWNVPNFDSYTNCNDRNVAAGFTGSITCRATKFVSEQQTFTSTANVTLTNNSTNESVTRSRAISLRNTSVPPVILQEQDVRDSISSYNYESSFIVYNSVRDRTPRARTRTSDEYYDEDGTFIDPSIGDTGGSNTKRILSLNYVSGSLCDTDGCSVSVLGNVDSGTTSDVCTTTTSGSGLASATLDTGRTGSVGGCVAEVTLRVTHDSSGTSTDIVVSLVPLVAQ